MDEPIIYSPWASREGLLIEPAKTLSDKLRNALLLDDKHKFQRLLQDSDSEPTDDDYDSMDDDFYGYLNSPYACLNEFNINRILRGDSPQIAMALINGEIRGIIDYNQLVFKNGWTPLHLASATPSPKLIKHLLERGDPVDVRCNYSQLHLKQATPLDLALEVIDTGYENGCYATERPWTLRSSIFELVHYVCQRQKRCLEVIRLLVQNIENKNHVRKAFFDYAVEGKFVKVAALFLAAPELFLSTSLEGGSACMSSIDALNRYLNSLDETTDIQQGLSLLLDVFDLVGHMLIAYIRLNDPKVWHLLDETISTFFLREAANKKLGISSRDDYLLSLFKSVSQHALESPYIYHYRVRKQICVDNSWLLCPFRTEKEDIDIDLINSTIPSLEPHEEDYLRKAIDNKLSIMPNICTLFEGTTRMPNKGEKQRFSCHHPWNIELPMGWSLCTEATNGTTRMPNKGGKRRSSFPRSRSIEMPRARSFCTEAANVRRRLDFKLIPRNGWESRVMNPTKLESFISAGRVSCFPMIGKCLIK